jgi:hypothetical protein
MNNDSTGSENVDLTRMLRALAVEDERLQASPHVRTTVMGAWDRLSPDARPWSRRLRRSLTLSVATGSLVAAAVAVVLMYRAPTESSRPVPAAAHPVEDSHVVTRVPSVDSEPIPIRDARQPQRPSPLRRQQNQAHVPSRDRQAALVLVMDPTFDETTASIVRLHVPRTALATLGMGLDEPGVSDSIEVEILVGEDGVARTIRRAFPSSFERE